MATAVWSGTITFGLVSVPVKLFTATSSHNVSFNLLHKDCKGRINLQNFCPQCDRVVERGELVKGYQYEKNNYVLIEDEDIDSIKPESSTHLDVVQFIDLKEVDPIFYERTYFLGADKGSEKTFALLAKAMEETNRAAVGRLTMRNHEYLAIVRPGLKGLVVHFMLYADEIRENEYAVPDNTEIRPKEMQLARQLIENLTEPFEPTKFEDDYVKKLEQMIESKISGRKLTVVQPKARPKMVDLLDALQKSVDQTRKEAKRPVHRAATDGAKTAKRAKSAR